MPYDRIKAAVAAGVAVLGESLVRGAQDKILTLGRLSQSHPAGYLEINESRLAFQFFVHIQSP